MSPHGSADYTQLSDDAFSHYTWKQRSPGSLVLDPMGYGTLVELSFTGVMGGWWAKNTHTSISYEVSVDDVIVHSLSASYIYTNKMWGLEFGFPFYGIGYYDTTNHVYVVWVNYHFKCYVHSKFKIRCFNPHAALQKQVDKSQIIYLER